VSVAATGGYGRGLMAPESDIDLLFILPYKQTAWGEQVAEAILYCLWDMGLKVGHATRSVDESIRQARGDMTIRTAILETRFLTGDLPLYNELVERFDKEVVQGTATEFVTAKLAEREERHRRAGQSRYLVEPNVKDGKGGLRDLHTLFWIAKYVYRVRETDELLERGVFDAQEYRTFRRCSDFLWSVRCNIHFFSGRAEERLSFDMQREIAIRLGYTSHPGMQDVERFMKHYFLVAKTVGDRVVEIGCVCIGAGVGLGVAVGVAAGVAARAAAASTRGCAAGVVPKARAAVALTGTVARRAASSTLATGYASRKLCAMRRNPKRRSDERLVSATRSISWCSSARTGGGRAEKLVTAEISGGGRDDACGL